MSCSGKKGTVSATNDAKNTTEFRRLEKFMSNARRLMVDGDFGKALSYFAYILHHAPDLKGEIHDDFLFALKSWCEILEENKKTEDLVNCLNEARKIFPDSAVISNHVGSMLFRLNLFDEAAVYFRRALTLDPELSNARENLDSVANLLVERWHFRMLNDRIRNQAYKDAIGRAVAKGCQSVLDIGSGTGILSMFAIQSGAKEVYACEMSKTMCDMSVDILQANQMQDKVCVINKKSHDLRVPDDLPQRVSLVVTETLDCGLLGEGIIETLVHARSELMVLENTNDIITEANKFAGSANNTTPGFNKQSSCNNEESTIDIKSLDKNGGLSNNDASKFQQASKFGHNRVIPEGATIYGMLVESPKIRSYARVNSKILDLDLHRVDIRGAEMSQKSKEPYTTEDMSCTPHTPLSAAFHVTSYDFRRPENYLLEHSIQIQVSVTQTGYLDAIVTWFDLKLDSVTTLSSAPGQSVCWEQAVYPTGLQDIGELRPGDQVVLDCKLTHNAVYFEVNHVIKERSRIDVKLNNSVDSELNYILPFSDISKLNDTELNEYFQTAIHNASAEMNTIVLCDSPTFNPLYAASAGFISVLCLSREAVFEDCLKVLGQSNGLRSDMIDFMTVGDDTFATSTLDHIHGSGTSWNVLIVDPIETSGMLRPQLLQDVVFAKGCILAKDSGIVVPSQIEVWGMLINSTSLCYKSHVISDDVTLGLQIADHMNTFQVRNQIDVDVTSNPYIALSDPVRLLTLDFSTPSDDDQVLLALLEMSCDTNVTAKVDGRVDGLMYWFELGFSETRRLSTGPQGSSHFNQVVIVFSEKLQVVCGQALVVSTSCKNSCITASVKR